MRISSFFRQSAPVSASAKAERKDCGFGTGVFLVMLGAGTLLAAWLLFQEAAKQQLVTSMASAARQGDLYVLIDGTDWVSVRDELKRDLKSRAKTNASLPNQDSIVEELVDFYVRPANVPDLVNLYRSSASRVDPKVFVRDIRFSGFAEMTVEIATPPQFNKPWLNALEPVRAVFKLDGFGPEGLSWRLKKIDAPDYLIPTQAPKKSV